VVVVVVVGGVAAAGGGGTVAGAGAGGVAAGAGTAALVVVVPWAPALTPCSEPDPEAETPTPDCADAVLTNKNDRNTNRDEVGSLRIVLNPLSPRAGTATVMPEVMEWRRL
jgi:hypothetical protein